MKVHIHHKGCYGIIKLFSKQKNVSSINGMTMSTYFDHYEKAAKASVDRRDRIMLQKLTTQTLLCPHCYQPFLMDDKMIQKQLVSPFIPVFDYISTIIFVCIPIAWIPLSIISIIGTMMEKFSYWFSVDKIAINERYSNKDYDR
eukprot:303922_1